MSIHNETLRFALGNAKLDKRTATFSIPSGHACPGAGICLSKADPVTGKVTDGPNTTIRCFQTSQESAFKTLRMRNWHNFNLLRTARTRKAMGSLLLNSLPDAKLWDTMRIHVGGDFFTLAYFQAWMDVARALPEKLFYAYTTSGHLFPKVVASGEEVPVNFRLTGSMAGKFTEHYPLLTKSTARIVSHPDETELEIDHDDSHAQAAVSDFALLIHGAQPAQSSAGAAVQRLKREGIRNSYPRKS